MIDFANPWLVLLLPLPWLWMWLMPAVRSTPPAVRLPFADRLFRADDGTAVAAKVHKFPWVQTVIWGLLVLALIRPQWLKPPVSREIPTRDLLLLIDLSGSMNQQDFTNQAGEKVDRLSAVKEVVGDFLLKREGDRVGLIVFGNAPYLQVPFTTDLELCRELLDETQVGMAGPRTAFGDAIGLGILQFDQSDAPSKTLIALTDGNDSASQVPPVEAARVAKDKSVRIHTIAIGDPETAGEDPLDVTTLQDVAKTGGGQYFFAGDRGSLEKIYDEIDKIETRKVDVVSHRPRLDLFPWVLVLCLLIQFVFWILQLRQLKNVGRSPLESATRRLHVDPRTGELRVEGEI
ncbi:VWA domain-containing protein [Kiritimatiellaeota bacterium B1221]|nr:VWA domain-containing protein [Kiritimatiellaeota bacterium B1221]